MSARDELDADVIATIDVIDTVAHAVKLYGSRERAEEMLPPFARPMPEHDYRFEVRRDDGAAVTFHAGATAQDVAEYFIREGWASTPPAKPDHCVCCTYDCGDRSGHVRSPAYAAAGSGDRCNCGQAWPCSDAAT